MDLFYFLVVVRGFTLNAFRACACFPSCLRVKMVDFLFHYFIGSHFTRSGILVFLNKYFSEQKEERYCDGQYCKGTKNQVHN